MVRPSAVCAVPSIGRLQGSCELRHRNLAGALEI
jgi:hypothetical protein